MNDAKSFVRFVTTCRSLVDKGSICARLTEDLAGSTYTRAMYSNDDDFHSITGSSDSEVSSVESVPAKKQRTRKSSTGPKTLKELDAKSDVSETEAKQGFIDEETGDKYYIVEKVIAYNPAQGYLVHWQGFPKSERTWQIPEDMPEGFVEEMELARAKYYIEMVARSNNTASDIAFVCSRCKQVEKKPTKKTKSVSYLEDVSEITDAQAAKGFVDDEGHTLYIVEDVLKYSSDGRFFVKWQGYPKSRGSWLERKDMPTDSEIQEKMKKLKTLFKTSITTKSTASSNV